MRFAASLENPGSDRAFGTPVANEPSGVELAGFPSQQSSVFARSQRTPKKKTVAGLATKEKEKEKFPLILYFAPARQPEDNLSLQVPKGPPPKFADLKRNGRTVVPIEAKKKEARNDKDTARVSSSCLFTFVFTS